MNFYVRAIGANRYAGGTDRWLKIHNIKRISYGFELEVYFNDTKKFVVIQSNQRTENLEFAEGWPGLKPITHWRLLEAWKF